VAKIFKRCPCPEAQWGTCPHQWVVRYRTTGGTPASHGVRMSPNRVTAIGPSSPARSLSGTRGHARRAAASQAIAPAFALASFG